MATAAAAPARRRGAALCVKGENQWRRFEFQQRRRRGGDLKSAGDIEPEESAGDIEPEDEAVAAMTREGTRTQALCNAGPGGFRRSTQAAGTCNLSRRCGGAPKTTPAG